MKRNERGVTLIALVVTIVVLLILAGTAIAMLSGDDGIMTNAQRSEAANTEGEIREKIKMAYNAVKTEISVNSAIESGYDASTNAEMQNLFEIAVKEIGLTPSGATAFNDGLTARLTTSTKQIYFQYNDNKFGGYVNAAQPAMAHSTINIDANIQKLSNGNQRINDGLLKPIRADIVLTTDNATLTMDKAQVL